MPGHEEDSAVLVSSVRFLCCFAFCYGTSLTRLWYGTSAAASSLQNKRNQFGGLNAGNFPSPIVFRQLM